MFKKIVRRLLIDEQKRFEDIELYIADRRTDINFAMDRAKKRFKADDFIGFRKDAKAISAYCDDIDEYLDDLRNSLKRINMYKKWLGLRPNK